jgi:hypothetical protein
VITPSENTQNSTCDTFSHDLQQSPVELRRTEEKSAKYQLRQRFVEPEYTPA